MYAREPELWTYVMCIRHATKDIVIHSMNKYGDDEFSLLSLEKQQRSLEFKDFSVFGKRGIVDSQVSWIPGLTNTLNYVVNEIILTPGEEITDFNGFKIKAENDCLVISNGRLNYRIKEKKDWSDLEALGPAFYAGHLGPNPLFEWQFKYWLCRLTLQNVEVDYSDPKDYKPHRRHKWCLVPISKGSREFEIYSIFVPSTGGAYRGPHTYRAYKTWYKSTWD